MHSSADDRTAGAAPDCSCGFPQMIATDLDGTLLRSDRTFSATSLDLLTELGNRNCVRVIATGRSVFSAERVLPKEFPIDYLIFSSGAGIMRWCDRRTLMSQTFASGSAPALVGILDEFRLDYMVHHPIPENHRFHYVRHSDDNPDFDRRLAIYQGFFQTLDRNSPPSEFSQILTIVDSTKRNVILEMLYERIGERANVILATSPLDGKTAWIEIFPPDTSKGTALRWLAKHTGVDLSATIAIGNDYNDTDMLETVGTAYVVANAPDELKTRFRVTTSHDADGFSIAIRQAMQTVVRQFGMESCKSPSSPG